MKLKNLWGKNPNEGFFRTTVEFTKRPEKAYIRIFVDTGYELFVNGRIVASIDEWCNVRDYDVTPFVVEGVNSLAVHGINHCGHRGFAFEMVADGETVVVSDSAWKVSENEKWGWTEREYDDSEWEKAIELDMSAAGDAQWWTKPGTDPDILIPTLATANFFYGSVPKGCASPFYTAKPIEYTVEKEVADIMGEEYVKRVNTPHLDKIHKEYTIIENNAVEKDGSIYIENTERFTGPSFIIDCGIEVVGYFRLKIKSDKPTSFRLYYGETLDEAMGEQVREILTNKMLREEYRVFQGEHEFQSRMRVGFRYVRVEFFDSTAPVTASGFSVKTSLYPVARRGYFECEDKKMNALYEAGERTLHYCMQEYYIDAVKRDRFFWIGDARMCALINHYSFADTELFEYSMREAKKVQLPCGGVPSVYGVGTSMLWDYVAWYVIGIYDYYYYTGKTEFVLEFKESIEKAVDFLTSKTNEDGLMVVPENPLGNLWMVQLNTESGVDPYMNDLYLMSLKTVLLSAKLAKDLEAEKKYAGMIENIEPKIKAMFDDDYMHKKYDRTLHMQIQYHLGEKDIDAGKAKRMTERLMKYFATMLDAGATTLNECCFGEEYDKVTEKTGNRPTYVSWCHGWAAIANVLLPLGIAGIKPIEKGFDKVLIKPEFNVYNTFKCVVPTPKGDIAVKYENKEFTYRIPSGVEAELVNGDTKTLISGIGTIKIN